MNEQSFLDNIEDGVNPQKIDSVKHDNIDEKVMDTMRENTDKQTKKISDIGKEIEGHGQ